mgnify:CR=1 FL=1
MSYVKLGEGGVESQKCYRRPRILPSGALNQGRVVLGCPGIICMSMQNDDAWWESPRWHREARRSSVRVELKARSTIRGLGHCQVVP